MPSIFDPSWLAYMRQKMAAGTKKPTAYEQMEATRTSAIDPTPQLTPQQIAGAAMGSGRTFGAVPGGISAAAPEEADEGLIEGTEAAMDEEEEPMRRLMRLYRQANPKWSWR